LEEKLNLNDADIFSLSRKIIKQKCFFNFIDCKVSIFLRIPKKKFLENFYSIKKQIEGFRQVLSVNI